MSIHMELNLTAKAETKKAILHTLGCDADDWLEAAKKQTAGFEGAKRALKESAKHVQTIATAITQDLDEGKLEGMGPLQVAEYAKTQLTRVVTSLAAQAQHFENLQLSSLGEVAALERVLKHFAKLHDAETNKIAQIQAALAAGELQVEDGSLSQSEVGTPGSRLPGVRPAGGIAAQRRAEDAATAATPKPEEDAEAKPEEAEVPTKRRGGRPKGSKNKSKASTEPPSVGDPSAQK